MGRYVLVDGDGVAVNTIIWDGETAFSVGDGLTLIPESDYKPPANPDADDSGRQ